MPGVAAMGTPPPPLHPDAPAPNRSVIDLQVEFLKLEIETVNSAIRQMDEFSKNIKQWAITLWTGAVGGALVTPRLAQYIMLTAMIPMLFWLVDARYRRIQQMFIWRSTRISTFLNDAAMLDACFREGRVVGFKVFDPAGRGDADLPEYKVFVHWKRPLRFSSLSSLYAGLILMSVFVGIASNLIG
jgi:hypothetical protein